MHYKRVGQYDRYIIMIAMLLASVLRVGLAASPNQEFSPSAAVVSATSPPAPASGLLGIARTSVGETVKATEKMMWGVGKFLLGAGESINYVVDVALGSVLDLLKAGGRAYDSVAARVGHLPVVGFGAVGVGEAVKTALDAMDGDVKHNMQSRRIAFEKLDRKMAASGARLEQRHESSARPAVIVFPQN